MTRLPAALLVALALTGCGSSAGEQLERRDSAALRRDLSQARTAATAGDRGTAADALRAFRIKVAKLRRAGRLDPALADQLRAGARQAEARVALEVAAPPTTEAPSAEQAPAPPAAAPRTDKPQPGKGNGRGRGTKEEDDDDD